MLATSRGQAASARVGFGQFGLYDAEEAGLRRGIGFELAGGALVSDLSVDEDVGAIDDREHAFGMVLDNHHADAPTKLDQRCHHFVDDGRGEALEWFVQQN